ncbi:hypothetical protein RN629_16960 [Sphingomonadaceae bacterium jetA1]|jgi:hypothetical protein|uniref:hypothetical protein n=1 Tax=Facivitalis istanbulensis TaxID=3075838 RepID=UPI00346ED75D
MTLRLRSILAAAAATLLVAAAPAGFYARQAQPIWDRIAGAPTGLRLEAPDRQTHVVARYTETEKTDGEVTLRVRGKLGSGTVSLGPGVGSELLWAPNSRAFAVTTSDGGANGLYRTIVVAAGGGGLQVTDLSPLIRSAFGHPVKCGWPEDPNVAIVQWRDGSQKVIVAAEIIAHSNCDSFGTFKAYEVDWRAGRITRTFDQIEAKRLFGRSMGIELRNAPNECIRSPRRCWVSTNHEPDPSAKPSEITATRRGPRL